LASHLDRSLDVIECRDALVARKRGDRFCHQRDRVHEVLAACGLVEESVGALVELVPPAVNERVLDQIALGEAKTGAVSACLSELPRPGQRGFALIEPARKLE